MSRGGRVAATPYLAASAIAPIATSAGSKLTLEFAQRHTSGDRGAGRFLSSCRRREAGDRVGDDAIVIAALPPAFAAARKETRVGGHGLLLYAWSGSEPGAARLLLLCLLLRSSWLTVEAGRQIGAAGVLHRRGGRAAVAAVAGVAGRVPEEQRRIARSGQSRLLSVAPKQQRGGSAKAAASAMPGMVWAWLGRRVGRSGCLCSGVRRPRRSSRRVPMRPSRRRAGRPSSRARTRRAATAR